MCWLSTFFSPPRKGGHGTGLCKHAIQLPRLGQFPSIPRASPTTQMVFWRELTQDYLTNLQNKGVSVIIMPFGMYFGYSDDWFVEPLPNPCSSTNDRSHCVPLRAFSLQNRAGRPAWAGSRSRARVVQSRQSLGRRNMIWSYIGSSPDEAPVSPFRPYSNVMPFRGLCSLK